MESSWTQGYEPFPFRCRSWTSYWASRHSASAVQRVSRLLDIQACLLSCFVLFILGEMLRTVSGAIMCPDSFVESNTIYM